MSFESEFDTAFVTALTGDATLTALLASASAVYKTRPFLDAGYPQITFSYADESNQALSEYGKNALALQIDVWGELSKLDAIRVALHNLLDERTRLDNGKTAAPFDMTNWKIKHFRYLRSHLIPTGRFDADSDNAELIHQPTEWEVRLYAA